MLSLVLAAFHSYFLMLTITNLAEPFNNPARFEAIQVNKTPCSIHWLPDLLRFNLLSCDFLILRFNSSSLSLVAIIFIHSRPIVKRDSRLYLLIMLEVTFSTMAWKTFPITARIFNEGWVFSFAVTDAVDYNRWGI